jgi:hypothetical protein
MCDADEIIDGKVKVRSKTGIKRKPKKKLHKLSRTGSLDSFEISRHLKPLPKPRGVKGMSTTMAPKGPEALDEEGDF